MKRLRKILLSKKHVGTYREINPETWVQKIRKRSRKVIDEDVKNS